MRYAAATADVDLSEADFTKLLFSNAKSSQGLARVYGFSLLYHTYRSNRSPSGYPDWHIIRLRDRRSLFIETKKEKGTPTAAQTEWLDGLAAVGHERYLWRPSDLTDGEIVKVLAHAGPVPAGGECDHCGRVFVHRDSCTKDALTLPIP